MTTILITAGGTSEYIDTVRKITNSSSGKLGSIIADTLNPNNTYIYYIHSEKAILPKRTQNIELHPITTTNDVKQKMETLLQNYKIDWVIHSMAISDYTVDFVTNADMLYNYLNDNGLSIENIKNNKNNYNKNTKIASSEDNLIITLKQTPKIISLIKHWQSTTHLIGFKLLSGVTEEELISVATKLKEKNKCDYVIANDLSNISAKRHKAFIIGEQIETVQTKQEIANKINELIKRGT